MNTIYITRRETFNAAHKLWQEKWSEEKNWEVFGKCSNQNWHGHNFQLFVTVKGVPDENTGFVMNLKTLSQILKEKVIEPLDHKNLNLDVPFFKGKMASTEQTISRFLSLYKAQSISFNAVLKSFSFKINP